jgi:hypothetical protein
MKTMRMMMIALVVSLAGAGCQSRQVGYDSQASADYRAAWQKKVAGDVEGYRAGLRQVASRYPTSRAGVRAKEELHPQAGSPGMLSFFTMLSQVATRAMNAPAALPAQ